MAVLAMAVIMSGCSCSSEDDTTTFNPKNVPAESASSDGKGNVVVNDNFGTISPTEKTTDKSGNTVISYTDSQGNKVTRTVKKDGSIHVVVKNKKGKVINDETYKRKEPATTAKPKKNNKKDDKKQDNKEHGAVVNDGDGWSDFY